VFANGLGLEAANSFLVIASPTQQVLVPAGDLAYHYSTTRYAEFCKETIFSRSDEENVVVRYKPLCVPSATNSAESPCLAFICPETGKYVFGKPLALEFTNIVTKDGWTFELVGGFLKRYISLLESVVITEGLVIRETIPTTLLPRHLLDCMPQNIMVDASGGAHVIDKEWLLHTPVELGHLIFRSLVFMCSSVNRFGRSATAERLTTFQFIEKAMTAIGWKVTQLDFDRFLSLEANIQQTVSGISTQTFFTDLQSQLLPVGSLLDLNNEKNQQIFQLNQQVLALRNSASWKLTAPMRFVSALFK
jgi:hypothetical protein